GEFLEILKL
ncbi:hypothetical protein VN97_g5580, partial [Penicillium thymicola]